MADESYGFTQVRSRLEEIVSAVRKKDTSLEKSLDLLEEGVRLANQCTELIDHADWEAAGTGAPIVADADTDTEQTDVDAGADADDDDAAGDAVSEGDDVREGDSAPATEDADPAAESA